MHSIANFLLALSFIAAIVFPAICLFNINAGKDSKASLKMLELTQAGITLLVSVSAFILLSALINSDFSFEYVASYTDRELPLFYRVTAFWAGQAGSLLFWAWAILLCGALFRFSHSYYRLKPETKVWFWIIFSGIAAFFLLVLIAWSSPFMHLPNPPRDGRGLMPLLQHPGMIFHPPLLFLGYAGFVIPCCLALAQALSGKRDEEGGWLRIARPYTLISWLFLSAGIILGAWWAYKELGWGGYWAWDPVENASLLPWFAATAFLHTALLESKRKTLYKTNILLIVLTIVLTIFATYLTRSGVVADSVHSYQGGTPASIPLLVFCGAFMLLGCCVAFFSKGAERALSGLFSREGLLLAVCVLLLTMGAVILFATLWPAINRIYADIFSIKGPEIASLNASFYNRVCLPLFVGLGALLLVCPWLGWEGKIKRPAVLSALALLPIAGAVALYFMGVSSNPLVLAAIGLSIALPLSLLLIFALSPALLRVPAILAAHGVHLGLALMFLGVACSGPLKQEEFFTLAPGAEKSFSGYTFTYRQAFEGARPNHNYIKAELDVTRDGKKIGVLYPERRVYGQQPSVESATLFSLGTELYASINQIHEDLRMEFRVSTQPLVNWIWIGGIILCLFPFLGAFARGRRPDDALPEN